MPFLRCTDPVETQNLASPSKQIKELPVKPVFIGSTGNIETYDAINRRLFIQKHRPFDVQDFQPLNDEERAIIAQTTQVIRDSIAIHCTACHYCAEGCPQQIAIPEYFNLYNMAQQFPQQKSNSKLYIL